MEIMTWISGDQIYGLELGVCQEVALCPRLKSAPHAPACIAGIMNLRGDVVTVLDLPALLGRAPQSAGAASTRSVNGAIIRLKNARRDAAIYADQILDVLNANESAQQERPANFTEAERRYVQGVILVGSRLIVVLNPEEFKI